MAKIKTILFILPWLLLLIAVAICIYRKDLIRPYIGDPNKPLYDSIQTLHNDRVILEKALEVRNHQYDSLLNIDQEVIIHHHDKVKYIFGTATADDLDRLIRTGIKTK